MREAERISSLRKVFVLKNGKREFPETKCGILPCSVLSNDMNAFDEETARLHKSAALMFTISPVSPAAQKKKKWQDAVANLVCALLYSCSRSSSTGSPSLTGRFLQLSRRCGRRPDGPDNLSASGQVDLIDSAFRSCLSVVRYLAAYYAWLVEKPAIN